jgi:hypothetical protein
MLFEKTRNRIKDKIKSAALGTFKKKWAEIGSLFGFQAPNRDETMLHMMKFTFLNNKSWK